MRKFGVVWVYIDLPGVVIWLHIHPSTLHAEKRVDKIPAAKGLLRPENSIVQKFVWYTGMRPWCLTDRKHHMHCSQSFLSTTGYLQVPIAGNHWLSLLVHLSSIYRHLLGSIHLKLLSCWVESTHPFAARVVDSRPLSSYIRHVIITAEPDVGFRCFWNHRFVWSTGIEPVNTSLETNPVTNCGQMCLTPVI